jgi:hypothetical protein
MKNNAVDEPETLPPICNNAEMDGLGRWVASQGDEWLWLLVQ